MDYPGVPCDYPPPPINTPKRPFVALRAWNGKWYVTDGRKPRPNDYGLFYDIAKGWWEHPENDKSYSEATAARVAKVMNGDLGDDK